MVELLDKISYGCIWSIWNNQEEETKGSTEHAGNREEETKGSTEHAGNRPQLLVPGNGILFHNA